MGMATFSVKDNDCDELLKQENISVSADVYELVPLLLYIWHTALEYVVLTTIWQLSVMLLEKITGVF